MCTDRFYTPCAAFEPRLAPSSSFCLFIKMVYQLIVAAVRQYTPWIMLPITITVGFAGYNLEGWLRGDRRIEPNKSIEEKRHERQLVELERENSK